MKKVFIIISSVIMSLTLIMILVMSLIKVNVKLDIDDEPFQIYVYNKDIVAYKNDNGNGYFVDTDKEYKEIIKQLNNMTNISVFKRLMNGISLDAKPEQDLDGTFTTYSSDLKKNYIAIELLYKGDRDSIVYYDGSSKTISYSSLIFIITQDKNITDIAIYYGSNENSATTRETRYKSNSPIYVKAQTKSIVNYINKLTAKDS